MKKMTRASVLAALVAPGLVSAQSTMQIGGQLKLGLDATSVSGAAGPGGTSARAYRESDNTSFWFIDGKERLNQNMEAYYHLEFAFALDTGAPGGPRSFFVGVAHDDYGRLQLGRQSIYFSHHWFINDIHGSFDAAPNAANSLNVLGTINGAYFAGNFFSNTVRYEFPVIAGFSGMASYSFDAEEPGMGRNHTWYISPTYTNGGLKAGYFHMQRDSQGSLPAQTVGSLDQTADKLAIGYTWNGWQVGVVVDRNRVNDRAGGISQDRIAYALPLGYGFGPHQFWLTWGQAFSMHLNGNTQDATGAKMLSLSYQYSLSKRTTLDLTYVELRNERNGRYNLWLGGIGGFQLAPADAGARARMVYAGLKHLF